MLCSVQLCQFVTSPPRPTYALHCSPRTKEIGAARKQDRTRWAGAQFPWYPNRKTSRADQRIVAVLREVRALVKCIHHSLRADPLKASLGVEEHPRVLIAGFASVGSKAPRPDHRGQLTIRNVDVVRNTIGILAERDRFNRVSKSATRNLHFESIVHGVVWVVVAAVWPGSQL